MLKISRLADYAVNVLVCLEKDASGPLSAQVIALKTTLALPTVKKVLKLLMMSNLVVSTQGARGGYFLARAATEITAAAIIEAIDGPISLTSCCHEVHSCHIQASCHVDGAWQGINIFIKQALSAVNLYQMAYAGKDVMNHIKLIESEGVSRYV